MSPSRIVIVAAICFFMANACQAKELVFISESDGRTPKIEEYKHEVIEELTRRCLQAKVAPNAIVDVVVDGHGKILSLTLSSTRLESKAEQSLTTELQSVKFGNRLTKSDGYLKMTLRFTVDPTLWDAKAAQEAILKKLLAQPTVSEKEYANQIQALLDQEVATHKWNKTRMASFSYSRGVSDRNWETYAKEAEEFIALGLSTRGAKELIRASLEAFSRGKVAEGKAYVERALAISGRLTWHQRREIFKELGLVTRTLLHHHYFPTQPTEPSEFLYERMRSINNSLGANNPTREIELLQIRSRISERKKNVADVEAIKEKIQKLKADQPKLADIKSSVAAHRQLATSATSSNNKLQAVVELKEALKLIEFEYGKASIESLPELCQILKLEMELVRAEDALSTARQILAVAEGYQSGEDIDRSDEWGYRHGLSDVEWMARDFGWHKTSYEASPNWKIPIAETIYRSQYILQLKNDRLDSHDTEEALLNLCGFLANTGKAQEGVDLFRQALKAYREVDPSDVKNLIEEYSDALERAGEGKRVSSLSRTEVIHETKSKPED